MIPTTAAMQHGTRGYLCSVFSVTPHSVSPHIAAHLPDMTANLSEMTGNLSQTAAHLSSMAGHFS